MSDHNPFPNFTSLSTDLTEHILSLLPISNLIRASAVCKSWNSIISTPDFSSLAQKNNRNHPWFFLFGLHNINSKKNQSFAFDPISNSWFDLPPTQDLPGSCFIGANGFFFTTTPRFGYSRILKSAWNLTSPLHFSRINPLVGVFGNESSSGSGCKIPNFIVVGGVRFIGGLVDIEDRLAAEVYDPDSDSWKLCPPLPADFRSGNSSQSLSSALFNGKFYVFGIYSCFISSFDLKNHVWSEVQTLRPPGVLFSFLISCQKMLILAGMCNSPRGPSFNLWKVHENTMEFSEIAIMPHSFLYSLVDSEEEDKFASLKCVGLGNLIYVPSSSSSPPSVFVSQHTEKLAMASIKVPAQVPSPAEDAEQLQKAFKGWGTNEELIISILAHRNASQRKLIRDVYAEAYGEDLLKSLEKELTSDFERSVLLWTLTPPERDAYLAHEATTRFHSSNWVLMEIACTRSSYELFLVKQAYHAHHKKSLEEDVAYHTKGDYRKLLVPLVSVYRYEGAEVNMTLAKSEAKLLNEKINDKAYSDEEVIRILTTRSKAQLNATLNHYNDAFGNAINKNLKEDSNDEFLKLLRATITCLTRPEKYFEKVLRQAIKKVGTDEWGLTRVVTTRAEVDMQRIKEEYQKRNSIPLEKAIAGDTSGDYQKMLLALIGHEEA